MVVNRRIASSLLTIAATLLAVGGVTYAAFTASATLSENTLSTGDVNINIGTLANPNSSTCGSMGSSIGGITTTGVVPGGSGSKYFCLRNVSTTNGLILDLKARAVLSASDSGQLDKSLISVKVKCVPPGEDPNNVDLATNSAMLAIDDVNESATLAAVPKAGNVTDSTAKCKITQSLSSSASDAAKNKSIKYDVIFSGYNE